MALARPLQVRPPLVGDIGQLFRRGKREKLQLKDKKKWGRGEFPE